MSNPDKLQLIFERWKASLRERDRSAENVASNFDELFDELAKAGATFEEAHAFLPSATKAHQPSPGLIRSFWKIRKSAARVTLSEKEFGEKWCNDIADVAVNSFYNSFPMQSPVSSSFATDKISDKEYKLMRQHADKFKQLDLNSLPDPNDELMTDEEEILKFIKDRMR
jgi:hypothetical protein